MNTIKKLMGFVWMLLAPVVIILLISGAFNNIHSGGTKDINQPIPWIIIIGIFYTCCPWPVYFWLLPVLRENMITCRKVLMS
jgi:uncharacterized membrane protein YadS